jgi:hypothetical protein
MRTAQGLGGDSNPKNKANNPDENKACLAAGFFSQRVTVDTSGQAIGP